MNAEARAVHDLLLQFAPDGAAEGHSCAVCAADTGSAMGTYSEEQLKAAVDEAVGKVRAELQTKIESLEAAARDADTDAATKAAVEAAVAEATGKLAEAQAALDVKVAEAEAAKAELAAVRAWLDDEAAKAQAQAELDARKDERVAAVLEVVAYDDEHVEANAQRWAEMDDAAFATLLDNLRAVNPTGPNGGVTTSALTAAADATAPGKGRKFLVGEGLNLRHTKGFDPRSVR